MSVEYRFLEPLDVLFMRGNKLFGDPGSHGEALIPPWPSVVAGAIRSRMLAEDRIDGQAINLAAFADSEIEHPTLGTPAMPGSFRVTAFQLARRLADGRVEALYQMPADLVVSERANGVATIRALTPIALAPTPLPAGEGRNNGAGVGLQSSAPLPRLPVLAESERSKPAAGYWLTQAGWAKYLAGESPQSNDLVKSSALWQIDPRVGVGLDSDTRRAADGRLFTVQAVAMVKRGHAVGTDQASGKPRLADHDVGFLAAVSGAMPPADGSLRLGGDGRAAAIQRTDPTLPVADYAALAQARRCRLVLATPGLFPPGWLPTGFSQQADGSYRFDLHGVRARLICAAVPRAEVVSGWDLARKEPKPAQRAAPTGSVYWLDELDATAESLRKLAEHGLWSDACEDAVRRAEGFNRLWLAAWN